MLILGKHIKKFPISKLSSKGCVLKLFGYYHFDLRKSVKGSITSVAKKLKAFYEFYSIPTQRLDNIEKKIQNLFDFWCNLSNNKNGSDDVKKVREHKFKVDSNNIFEVFPLRL